MTSIDEIDGFSEIKEADRIIIKEMIDEGNLKRKNILTDPSHQKKSPRATAPRRPYN